VIAFLELINPGVHRLRPSVGAYGWSDSRSGPQQGPFPPLQFYWCFVLHLLIMSRLSTHPAVLTIALR